MAEVNVGKDISGRIVVSFPYDPSWVEKIKTVPRHRWHPAEKHWSFPDSDGTLERILKVFEGEEIHIDPVLQSKLPSHVIASLPVGRQGAYATKQSQGNPSLTKTSPFTPTLEKGGKGGFSDKKLSTTNFDDLKRELLSRKYSYKTVKGYLYYNRDFIRFAGKAPSEINDNDIKSWDRRNRFVYNPEIRGIYETIASMNKISGHRLRLLTAYRAGVLPRAQPTPPIRRLTGSAQKSLRDSSASRQPVSRNQA